MKTIADYHNDRDNNFNLIRFLLALFVLTAHGFNIYSNSPFHPNPFVQFLYEMGFLSLDAFFTFSGFMVTASIMQRGNLTEYTVARALRIFPALLLVSTFAAFIIGPLSTTLSLPEYFSSIETYNYVLITSITTEPDMPLPGVFKDQAALGIVNLPIWTLRYELFMYVVTALVFIGGMLNRSMAGWITFGIFILYAVKILVLGKESGIEALDHLAHFSLSYSIGMAMWIYRDRIILAWQPIPLLILSVWFAGEMQFSETLQIVVIGYIIFWLAYVPNGYMRNYNRLGDYSYGIYIWHWPIASLILAILPQIQPSGLIPLVLIITVPIAMLSWHFVERPALKSKAKVVQIIRTKWPRKNVFGKT